MLNLTINVIINEKLLLNEQKKLNELAALLCIYHFSEGKMNLQVHSLFLFHLAGFFSKRTW